MLSIKANKVEIQWKFFILIILNKLVLRILLLTLNKKHAI